MSKGKNNKDQDLTRIENLSEFLHEQDDELDSIFKNLNPDDDKNNSNNSDDSSQLMSLDELEDNEGELPPALPMSDETEQEIYFESTENDSDESSDENSDETQEEILNESSEDFATDFTTDFTADESNSWESSSFEAENEFATEFNSEETEIENTENIEETEEVFSYNAPIDNEPTPPPVLNQYESLKDVKSFGAEFSYGKANVGSGNPPFSIIARNIEFLDDAEDIKILLREFGILNDDNLADYEQSLSLGSVLISQISEYVAIVLAHKLRRFNLDLEVGLSDEIHPSKSGESNPRGLIKKETLKQNKKETLTIDEQSFSIKDIISTTAASLSKYQILDYHGVHSTMTVINQEDLEKLQFVDQSLRANEELAELEMDDLTLDSSLASFKSFQKSFTFIFDELVMRLKQKAFTMNVNALMSVNFQVNPIIFERNYSKEQSYQIICSATLATIKKES